MRLHEGGGATAAFSLQFVLIAIRLTLRLDCSDFGSVTVRTPFLNFAWALSSSTPSSGIWRSNDP